MPGRAVVGGAFRAYDRRCSACSTLGTASPFWFWRASAAPRPLPATTSGTNCPLRLNRLPQVGAVLPRLGLVPQAPRVERRAPAERRARPVVLPRRAVPA